MCDLPAGVAESFCAHLMGRCKLVRLASMIAWLLGHMYRLGAAESLIELQPSPAGLPGER